MSTPTLPVPAGTNSSTVALPLARSRLSSFGRQTLAGLGLASFCALGLMFFNPEIADALKAVSPFARPDSQTAEAAEPASQMPALVPVSAALTRTSATSLALPAAEAKQQLQQERVTNWLSRRYRVATDATNVFVATAYKTAQELKLDPLLILSVIAIESRFNPFAESPVGAQGLMQVMSKVHQDKFEELGGADAALNPMANIHVGSQILKEYVNRGGSLEAGLKLYVGAGALDTDFGYGAKVLAEYERLKLVASGKKVSIYATSASAAPPKPRTDKAVAPAAVSTSLSAVGQLETAEKVETTAAL